jgi:nucleotide-binding universal stress UspA family protein
MTRIILTLDGSRRAESGIALANDLARATNAAVDLVHVVEPVAALNGSRSARKSGAASYLRRIAADLEPGRAGGIAVLVGKPAVQIDQYARGVPDPIVIVSARSRGVSQEVFGSVTSMLLEIGDYPVAIALGDNPRRGSLETLLVPLDGTSKAEPGIHLAQSIAGSAPALIRLVQVVEPDLIPDVSTLLPDTVAKVIGSGSASSLAMRSLEARFYLESVSQRLRARGIRSLWEVRTGRTAEEVLRDAETTGTDLIVVANRRSDLGADLFLREIVELASAGDAVPILVAARERPARARVEPAADLHTNQPFGATNRMSVFP